MGEYKDITLICKECGEEFILFATKQRSMAEKGIENPKRCYSCLKKRREAKQALEFTDKKLVCIECGQEFIFSAEEQQFYKNKGLENEPVRCPSCRKARKDFFNSNK